MYTRQPKTQTSHTEPTFNRYHQLIAAGIIAAMGLYGCTSSNGAPAAPAAQELPVLTLQEVPASTYREYSASIQGTQDIAIRPQVDGYLEEVYVDEGAFVRKGQRLFRINDKPYQEQLHQAQATLAMARANKENASINVDRLTPLVSSNVVSDVQLKTANANNNAGTASVSLAQAQVQAAAINVGYTVITAPVDGYVGRLPFKKGSLVGTATTQPLTTVSAVKQVYAYFSFSEKDFLELSHQLPGNSIEEKIKHLPEVELVLADNSIYPAKGKVETVDGQFDGTMGTISFRAAFPNDGGLLRSGNTGKVRISASSDHALVIPQEATFELQDKLFAFAVSDSNKVVSTPLKITGKSGSYYLLSQGLQPGSRIVFAGIDRLHDGDLISPQAMSMDSLLKVSPL